LNQKGLEKGHLGQFSASPVASTNQILIEDVLQVEKSNNKASNQCQAQ